MSHSHAARCRGEFLDGVDVLIKRGWLLEADRAHSEYLVKRKQQKHVSGASVSLASVADSAKRSQVGPSPT